jgi:hypothetical protein
MIVFCYWRGTIRVKNSHGDKLSSIELSRYQLSGKKYFVLQKKKLSQELSGKEFSGNLKNWVRHPTMPHITSNPNGEILVTRIGRSFGYHEILVKTFRKT